MPKEIAQELHWRCHCGLEACRRTFGTAPEARLAEAASVVTVRLVANGIDCPKGRAMGAAHLTARENMATDVELWEV